MEKLPEGFGVLVTRPAEQADSLCRLVEQAGGKAIRLPLQAIVPLEDDCEGLHKLSHPGHFDWLVFVSANAVRCAFDSLGTQWVKDRQVKITAIGLATAQALETRGIVVDLRPKQPFNSESLLAMPQWSEAKGQKFLIVRGVGGRELLAETLRQRGGLVEYAEIYRRVETFVDGNELLARFRLGEIGAITLANGEALERLYQLMAGDGMRFLLATPLVVIGERIGNQARNMGFHCVIAAPASDADIFDAVCRIAREVNQHTNLRG